VLEWRDPAGSPRYGCVYGDDARKERDPLPLVVFFHGTAPALDDPSALAKLTDLRKRASDFALGGEQEGFVVLAVQGRAIEGSDTATFDTDHASVDNLDKLAVDHFVDELVDRKVVDPRRIYALGLGRGGTMAITYGMLRADRVAATAAYAPWTVAARWQCPTPAPPVKVLYRACDGLIACDAVEEWLRTRESSGAITPATRLDDGSREEPACATRAKCTNKRGVSAHHRWPKGREDDVLRFLSRYVLERPALNP
jgi:predicted esterase